jgi:hypothetical protein
VVAVTQEEQIVAVPALFVGHRWIEALATRLGCLDMADLRDEVATGVDQRVITAGESAKVSGMGKEVARGFACG